MKKTILNLVSRWCDECRELYRLYKDSEIERLLRDYEIRYYDIDEYPHMLNRFNFGGIPSIVFIEGDKLLYGFSGVPSKKEMIKIIDRIDYYERIDLRKLGEEEPEKRDLSNEDVTRLLNQVMRNIDWLSGGFIEKYKFPHLEENMFLIRMYLRRGVEGYLKTAVYNLEKMLFGGLWDDELGGLSRSSSRDEWINPDRKYLVELNSYAFKILYFIYILTREKRYLKYIERLSVLLGKKLFRNGFIRGLYIHDGDYYLDERIIPHIACSTSRDIIEVAKYGEFRRLGYKAIKSCEKIYGDLDRRYQTLYTYVKILDAYIEAYSYIGEKHYFNDLIEIYKIIKRDFRDETGAFRDVKDLDFSQIIRRPFKINSELAYSLLKIYYLTGEDKYRDDAYSILKYYSNLYEKHGFEVGLYGISVDSYLNGIPILLISGFNKIPRNVIRMLKPFTLYKWVEGEKKIEYAEGDIKIRLV